ncbi:MAG TPA: hypothetical protein VHD58_09035 [Mycobacteriales bacterium]|nr:hypothetical protein [Mycobacteriales bacterium]
MARLDHRPARKAIYLQPLRQLRDRCVDKSVDGLGAVVVGLANDIRGLPGLGAPAASAEAALVATARSGTDCEELAAAIGHQLTGRIHTAGGPSLTTVRFSPPLTAELALAAIRRSLRFGRVRVVYALRAYGCQQAIFMGPSLARRYGNPSLGAFVELTSGDGVGHGKYDAGRVNRARITPFGRIGGQPCR